MKILNLSKEEIEKLKKEGRLRQVHLGSVESVLKPRGSMEKESLGLYIFERLQANFEHWTNPKYSDNPDLGALLFHLKSNLDSECQAAWSKLLKQINSEKKNEVPM